MPKNQNSFFPPSLSWRDPVCEETHKQHQWAKEHQPACAGPLQCWSGTDRSGHPVRDPDSLPGAQRGTFPRRMKILCSTVLFHKLTHTTGCFRPCISRTSCGSCVLRGWWWSRPLLSTALSTRSSSSICATPDSYELKCEHKRRIMDEVSLDSGSNWTVTMQL